MNKNYVMLKLSDNELHWYVANTCRQEKKIKQRLDSMGIENFIPFQQIARKIHGVDKLIERALPEKYKKDVRKYRARFDEIYKENCLKHTKPYSGMKELIDELYHQGYKLAVVTNKPKINAVTIVNHLFPGKFMYVFGNTVYQPKKPHPCLVQLAMQLMESNKNETLMIGDSNVDIETAINAKIKSVGCEWGFRGKEELVQAGATYTVSKPSDIKDILK